MLSDFVFFFRSEGAGGIGLLADPILHLFSGLFSIAFIFFLHPHVVGLEEKVLTLEVLALFEEGLELLRKVLDDEEFLALLRGFKLFFGHQLYNLKQSSPQFGGIWHLLSLFSAGL